MKSFFKKFLCILLVSLFVCMPAFATDYGKKFRYSLEVDGKNSISVVVGSEFTVQLKLNRIDSKASGKYTMYVAEDYIKYDPEYVSPITSMIELGDSGFKLVKTEISDGDYEKFRVRRKNADGELVSDDITVFNLTFKADKVGKITIRNEDYIVSTEDTREGYSCSANNLSVNIVKPEDKGSDTIDTSSVTSFYMDCTGDVANDGEMEAYFSEADTQKIAEKASASLDLVLTAKPQGSVTAKDVLFELKNTIVSTVAAMNKRITLKTPIAEIKFNNTWLRSAVSFMTSAKEYMTFEIESLSKDQLNKDQASKVNDSAVIYKFSTIINDVPRDMQKGSADVTVSYTIQKYRDEERLVVYKIGDEGELLKLPCTYDSKMKTLSFTIPQNGVYAIVLDELSKVEDVSVGDWYYDAANFSMKKNLFNGVTDCFDGSHTMTRAMLVDALYRFAGQPRVSSENVFTDVEAGSWYENAIIWAYSKGIVSGYSDTQFAPDDSVSREQVAAILMRYIQTRTSRFSVDESTELSFTDAGAISDYAVTPVKFCAANQILSGRSNGKFDPKANVTRAEIATILMRLNEKL